MRLPKENSQGDCEEDSEDDQICSDVELMAQSKKFNEKESSGHRNSKYHLKMEKLLYMSSEIMRQPNKSEVNVSPLASKRKIRTSPPSGEE